MGGGADWGWRSEVGTGSTGSGTASEFIKLVNSKNILEFMRSDSNINIWKIFPLVSPKNSRREEKFSS